MWKDLEKCIQNMKANDFETLVAELLTALLNEPFLVARAGDQPSGDARSRSRQIVIQAKRYTTTNFDASSIEGDIHRAKRTLPELQVYVLAVSRDVTAQLRDRLDDVEEETGLDIVTLELSDKLSDIGALCVTFWKDVQDFDCFATSKAALSKWVQEAAAAPETQKKIEELRGILGQCIWTYERVQKEARVYLGKRFGFGEKRDHHMRFLYEIDLSKARQRKSLASAIVAWWRNLPQPCYLEGEEGVGKSWLAAEGVKSICDAENVVTFWLDSPEWEHCKSIQELLRSCFKRVYSSRDARKIVTLQKKIENIWRQPTLIVLDGVNEREAITAAKRILDEYFAHEDAWKDRIRLLFTTRPLEAYRDFEHTLWRECHPITVLPFNDSELTEALDQEECPADELPDTLREIARIPRYFQTCVRLRERLQTFDAVTKELVLWVDLCDKIERTDRQIRQKLVWQRPEDAEDILAKLAREAKWRDAETAPHAPSQLLQECFDKPSYSEIRQDLVEQRIASKASKMQAVLSPGHVILGWALYLSKIFDATAVHNVRDLADRFQQELEPIPSEGLRTEALFVALQLTAIAPPDIPSERLSQKRAALMHAWLGSHNAQQTAERVSFWAEEDPGVYAHFVELQFEASNALNRELALIEPLATVWREEAEKAPHRHPYLTRWLRMPAHPLANQSEGSVISREMRKREAAQTRLAAAALSILSQRPAPQFLKTLAKCAAHLRDEDNRYGRDFDRTLSLLMRWGYTEAVVDALDSLAEQADEDSDVLAGVRHLAASLCLVELPPRLQRPLSTEEKEWQASVERSKRNSKSFVSRYRDKEPLFTSESLEENAKRGYHGLGQLAVRTDLPALRKLDRVKIKKVLRYILPDAGRHQNHSMTLEVAGMQELMPWCAKFEPEDYAKLACDFKVDILKHNAPLYNLHGVQGVIFEPNDCAKLTEAILGMQHRLAQEDTSSQNIAHDASLLTQTLLFTATADELMEWFEFLAEHEPLRPSIAWTPFLMLFPYLLPESIVKLARQKVQALPLPSSDAQTTAKDGTLPWSEQEYWCALYAYGTHPEPDAVNLAMDELKRREPNAAGTFPLLCLALSEPHQFLVHAATDERLHRHLFAENSLLFKVPIYEGNDAPPEETLKSLPPEIVGSFLCSPDRRTAFSRWGRDLLKNPSSILQGPEGIPNLVAASRFAINRDVLRIWAEQHLDEFLEVAEPFLSQQPLPQGVLIDLTDAVLCLLLRFNPELAMKYYRLWEAENARTVYHTYYRVPTFLAQLWRVKECNLPAHRQFRRSFLEETPNDYNIMCMTLAALAEGGGDELWQLATQEYLASNTAKERNLGVSILPWFGNEAAIALLKRLQSEDPSDWVRRHAKWAYEVAQQEQSCRAVYREALQTRDLLRISAVFEPLKPALSPIALWWHHLIEEEELGDFTSDSDAKLHALLYQFWYRWSNSLKSNPHRDVFDRRLRDYCRGDELQGSIQPKIAPWWEPR